MATSKEIIGKSLKLHREKKGIGQQQMADLLGIDRQYMWKLETGKINMTLDYLDGMIERIEGKHEDFLIHKGFNKFK